MKILITGGAGFIGAHTGKLLHERGDEITIFDDFNSRYDPRLKEARVQHLLPTIPRAQIIRGDITHRDLVDAVFAQEKFDAVIHLAAWASVLPSIENPYIYTSVNVDGTVNILEAARKNAVSRFIFASSSSVYGGQTTMPCRETANISRPISPYAATKAAGELLCATWHNLYGIPISCLRFFTVYGPWGRPEMALFKFAHAITNNETVLMHGRTTERDFTYIDDIVQGIVAALDHPRGYTIYNLGESDAVPLPRVIAALESSLHRKATIQEVALPVGSIPRSLADITRAQAELGYQPSTPIERGVEQFVHWYQDVYVPLFG